MQHDDSRTGSEDTSRNVRAVQNAAENRDALAREARRVEATAPDSVSHPVDGTSGARTSADRDGGATAGAGGDAGTMHASEDATEAREHVREAAENRDALAEEARRVDATTPPDIDRDRR